MHDPLPAPHGRSALPELLADSDHLPELKAACRSAVVWDLTPRQLCDLELLLNGGFSPLGGFMERADYESVCRGMRLKDGTLWPIPVVLDVTEDVAVRLARTPRLALHDPEGTPLALLRVEEVWKPDRRAEAEAVYGTTDLDHPGVAHLLEKTHTHYVGGRVEGLQLPAHYDFSEARLTPRDLRERFTRAGWRHVVAFQTRNPMHRAHFELTLRAATQARCNLLLHPSVGMTRPGDIDHYTRVRAYQALLPRYPAGTVMLSLLPLAMRMAGPREAVWHAIIRKNYGCSHFIVGRDHAGPGSAKDGRPFYDPYAAQQLVQRHERDLGVRIVPFQNMVYLEERDTYVPEDQVPSGLEPTSLSGTEMRRRLAEGRELPGWFTFPEVEGELRRRHPPRSQAGFTIFFTGLSGAGKSTVANILVVKFLEMGGRPVTLLDGDIVRKHLSSELGFSREHRDVNIRRIGFVASEITKNGGVAICAPIAPYDSVRKEVRAMASAWGGFVLVHMATSIEVCEQRDRKGLYAKARAGQVANFTGVNDPYEAPADAEVVISGDLSPEQAANEILLCLERDGYLRAG